MKICLYADPHYSQTSSILRGKGEVYSIRLEGLIKSLNWVEQLAVEHDCTEIVCLGDFFDKPQLNSEELTALQEINFNPNILHTFIVGNHEMYGNVFSSAHLFNLNDNCYVVDQLSYKTIGETQVYYLPYVLECNREGMSNYVINKIDGYKTVVLSHNDIKGIQMGQFISTEGFDIEDIERNCDLFINGHLHNGQKITDKIINIGNLTGQNFSEDGSKYSHYAVILDLDTLELEFFENPHAFYFYKLNLTDFAELEAKALISSIVDNNLIVTAKVLEEKYAQVKAVFDESEKVIASRLVIESKVKSTSESDVSVEDLLSIDHIEQFKTFCAEQLGNTDIVIQELLEVTK